MEQQIHTVVQSRRHVHLARTDVFRALARWPRLYLVYAWLESMAGVATGDGPYTNADIAADLGCGAQQVARAMRLLERLGLISQLKRGGQRVGFMVHHDLERAQRTTLRALYTDRYTIDWAAAKIFDEQGAEISHARPEVIHDLGGESPMTSGSGSEVTDDLRSRGANSLQQANLDMFESTPAPGGIEKTGVHVFSTTSNALPEQKSIALQNTRTDNRAIDPRWPKRWQTDAYWSEIRHVYEAWLDAMGFHETTHALTAHRRSVIRARLREGCTVAMLERAAHTVAASRWHRGDNKAGRAYDDVEHVFRNRSRVEQYQTPFRERHRHHASQANLGRRAGPIEVERL